MKTSGKSGVPPVYLLPNIPYTFSNSELQSYFNASNSSSQGLGSTNFSQGGRLPEGNLEFCVEVLEYYTSRVLSRKTIAFIWLRQQKPPLLNTPSHWDMLTYSNPQNILFQWTLQHSGSDRVEYELIIKELWDKTGSPTAAFAYSPEVYRTRLSTTFFRYNAMHPPLLPGHRYAWAVKAVAVSGITDVNIFENDGLSEVRAFEIEPYCPVPEIKSPHFSSSKIGLEWEKSAEHLHYISAYRQEGADTWREIKTANPNVTLSGIRKGKSYEYRIASYCTSDHPVYTDIFKVTIPEDTLNANCGKQPFIDLSNTQHLEELEEGEQFTAGDFIITVKDVRKVNGRFSGTGTVPVHFLGNLLIVVTFESLVLNTDYRMLEGSVESSYDPTEGGIYNADALFEGQHKVTPQKGVTHTDLTADFVLREGDQFMYDPTDNKIVVWDEEQQILGELPLPQVRDESTGGYQSNVFPMTVEDKEGNLFTLDQDPESSDRLICRKLGHKGTALTDGEFNPNQITYQQGAVYFENSPESIYAFDKYIEGYASSALLRDYYKRIGPDYHVCYKFIPVGKSDKVRAQLKLTDKQLSADQIVFVTPRGTRFIPSDYDPKRQTYTLNLVGGEEKDGYELYALHPKVGGGYYTLGKLQVVTYPSLTVPVKVVPVNWNFKDFSKFSEQLKQLYDRVGVRCEINLEQRFDYEGNLNFFGGSSGLLSAYTSAMKELQGVYGTLHTIEKSCVYLFVFEHSLKESGKKNNKKDRDATAFMPRNKQFAYLFYNSFPNFQDAAVAAAHEIGHGYFKLKHTFDGYGLAQGTTENLMDYAGGTDIAKWQWDQLHDMGIVFRVFERDEDAMWGALSITWLTQYLFVLQPDKQDKAMDAYLPLFEDIWLNYADYQKQSLEKDQHLTLKGFETWSIRKASNQGIARKVFEGVIEKGQSFSLHDKGIYLENYKMNEISYNLVVLAHQKSVSLNPDIYLSSYSRLRGNHLVRAGYTDKYGIICFYDHKAELQMSILITEGITSSLNVMQWLNYLGIVLPSETLEQEPKREQEQEQIQEDEDEEDILFKEKIKWVQKYLQWQLEVMWGIKHETEDAVKRDVVVVAKTVVDSVVSKWRTGPAMCNICVRNALYELKNETVLFPKGGSFKFLDEKNDPYIRGLISGDGMAEDIITDLDNYETTGLNDYFVEEKKAENESYEEFWGRLQDLTDKGEVIVGAYAYESRDRISYHVFMLVSGGKVQVVDNLSNFLKRRKGESIPIDIYKGDLWGLSFAKNGVKNVPRILECGIGVKSSNAPLYATMGYDGILTTKWYRYIK
ncbi:hypothetical protein LJC62_00190 [Odoribacter sp. OttesenSCG-928-A06]|nr:hypothetical protein [Odoribacter sp. OttesenSCG-928-A06]